MMINTNIKFTPQEQESISIIKEIATKYSPNIQVFVVGGIIRDRLRGLPSKDLDIMVYPIKAEEFAKLITTHLNIKDPHIIKENPEKSRLISTSKIYLPTKYGVQEIDIAQARQDVYEKDSRIPETKPATPEQDASRRDFTINSVMLRIYPPPQEIVDFTGMGIKDLISNVIRTPLDPLKTFSDDPLRIFRAIVYAAKLNAQIDPQTYAAMSNLTLRNEIKKKVSKERVGAELEKMLRNKNSQIAIQLLYDTGLMQDVVSEALIGTKYEGKMSPLNMPQQNIHHKLNLWEHSMQVVKNLLEMHPEMEEEKRIVMILAAVMHDLGKLFSDIKGESRSHPGSISYHGHEKESQEIASHILKYLKMEPLIKSVSMLAQKHMIPHRFTEQNSGGIKALRRFIRQCGEDSVNYLDVLNLAIADALAKDVNIDPQTLSRYQELEQRLQEALLSLKPIEGTKIEPVLNGNEIMQILNIKAGPWMTEITEFVKELKDENPNITKEEAANKLKEKYGGQEFKREKKTPKTVAQTIAQTPGVKEDKVPDSVCPMHLLKAKISQINELYKEQHFFEIITTLKQLKDDYGNDEKVSRFIAITLFELLRLDPKLRDNNILEYLFDKAEHNFFDTVLCSYVVGLLLLLKTSTEDKIIKEIANRMINMSPGILRSVLDKLPQNSNKTKLINEIKGLL